MDAWKQVFVHIKHVLSQYDDTSDKDVLVVDDTSQEPLNCTSNYNTVEEPPNLISLESPPNNESIPAILAQSLTRALLDVTFVAQEKLHELYNFEVPPFQVQKIINELSLPSSLCCPLSSLSVLGKELDDCLLYRRGELCYMYINVLMSKYDIASPLGIEAHTSIFLDSAIWHIFTQGVAYLTMLSQPDLASNYVYTNNGSAHSSILVSQGIRSDSHLLAVMYVGELLFWAWQSCTNINFEIFSSVGKIFCANGACLSYVTSNLNCCSKCKIAFYCSVACQKRDWKEVHKRECSQVYYLYYTHLYQLTYTHTRVYIQTYIHACIHTYRHTYIHT